ncbi:transposase [Gemmatimonas sp.]|uniref:transposase n=1 Tax=Gemmatimonas sp. TaxID=1962908 RepID=UPI0025B9C93B|nr:transposase [Gemmatimonas sp.]MCA2991779.1 transposase [Gemmatimonas sp.]
MQGVSARKVRQIVEQRRGETVNASAVSRATKQLDGQLAAWRARKLERENEKIRRRTRVVRRFPSEASYLRLATALAADRSDQWAKRRYIMPASTTINVKRALKTPCAVKPPPPPGSELRTSRYLTTSLGIDRRLTRRNRCREE